MCIGTREKVQVLMMLTFLSGALPFPTSPIRPWEAAGPSVYPSPDVSLHFLALCCLVLYLDLTAMSPPGS